MRRIKTFLLISMIAFFPAFFLCGCTVPVAEEEPAWEDVPKYGGKGNSPPPPAIHRPPWKSKEDLTSLLRHRIENLYAAKDRDFTPLDGVVEDFSVTELPVPAAVAQLSNDCNVLCGIEVIPWPVTTSVPVWRISLSIQHATPGQILDKLVSMDPNFIWFEDQGIANLVMREAYESPDYPLNRRIPHFQVKDRPLTRVFSAPRDALFGLSEVWESLAFGGGARWPVEFEPRVSVDAIDLTVRQIINEVARKVGMSWSAVASRGYAGNGRRRVGFRMHPEMPRPRYYDRTIGR
ncbi:MAG: hypothetical protein ACYSTG_07640 [Planctomycetota bacterium]|jgi:hypothetical protein